MPSLPPRRWALALAVAQVEAAGLAVTASAEGDERWAFHDVGALAWYLKAVPWGVPGFSMAGCRPRLTRLHAQIEADSPLVVRLPYFLALSAQALSPGRGVVRIATVATERAAHPPM